jgi:hypothetical protein
LYKLPRLFLGGVDEIGQRGIVRVRRHGHELGLDDEPGNRGEVLDGDFCPLDGERRGKPRRRHRGDGVGLPTLAHQIGHGTGALTRFFVPDGPVAGDDALFSHYLDDVADEDVASAAGPGVDQKFRPRRFETASASFRVGFRIAPVESTCRQQQNQKDENGA